MIAGIGKLRNRQLAHAVLAAFAAGFLGLPCLHQLAHQRPHRHGADGFSIQWLDQDHDAGAAAHALAHQQGQAHAHGPAAESPAEPARPTPPADVPPGGALAPPSPAPHGPGGASHFGVGLVAPTVYLLPPPAAEAVVLTLAGRPAQPAARFPYAVAHPRGPPAA
jgi:hypothetical protein